MDGLTRNASPQDMAVIATAISLSIVIIGWAIFDVLRVVYKRLNRGRKHPDKIPPKDI